MATSSISENGVRLDKDHCNSRYNHNPFEHCTHYEGRKVKTHNKTFERGIPRFEERSASHSDRRKSWNTKLYFA